MHPNCRLCDAFVLGQNYPQKRTGEVYNIYILGFFLFFSGQCFPKSPPTLLEDMLGVENMF